MAKRNWISVVLSGGPSSGKSSSQAYLSQKLGDRGVRTLFVPEVATQVISGGVSDIARLASEDSRAFQAVQTEMLLLQAALRERYTRMAAAFAPEPVVVVFDRAEMDVSAYMGPEAFKAACDEHHLRLADIRDSYDAVIHLVTAALGAEEHYSSDNNEARYETAEQARAADRRVLAAWTGCPHLWIVGNEDSFDVKLERVLACVLHALGRDDDPAAGPAEIERKFLLAGPPDFSSPELKDAVSVEIEQTYLLSSEPGVELRVRKRTQDGQSSYFHTRKVGMPDGSRQETEALISPSEYIRLLSDADPARRRVRKRRHCFPHEGLYFELDAIERPGSPPLHILEVELLHAGQPVVLPSCLTVEREVTDDPAYRNSQLARA